jgi:2-dehydro-3-deoxy-D-arabinonate dehydratase
MHPTEPAEPVRLCSIHAPGVGAILCLVRDGHLYPVGSGRRFGDLAELIRSNSAGSLEAMVDRVGISGDPIAPWETVASAEPSAERPNLRAPIRPLEVWAAGVTYERSLSARKAESQEPDVYERVYEAERPELFFKATGQRVVGPNDRVGLRSDSRWQVPEPELALVLDAAGAILGYTLGNDMSSRDIEGANPLYLPQAKIFAGSCALGPAVVSAAEVPDPYALEVTIRVSRQDSVVFQGRTSTSRLHVKLDRLIAYLMQDNWIAPGTVLLTGTGVVPDESFSLQAGDVIEIASTNIGTLRNRCAPAAQLPTPDAWLL